MAGESLSGSRCALAMSLVLASFLLTSVPTFTSAQTALGELEGRPAPLALRKCIAGSNTGSLCNEDSDCPGSTCADRNIFSISVAMQFDATVDELDSVKEAISAGSAVLFDATDGQAEIGQATIHNNAFGTTDADLRVYPASDPTWWRANTGNWRVGGSMHVSIDNIQAGGALGEFMAHEFLHLAFDPRDEYEDRPGCMATTSGGACPIDGSGGTACIMDAGGSGFPDGQFGELCWGQADLPNFSVFTNGDHDADNSTEQSQCRSNRSCWDQVVWSYPNTILKPDGPPDPGANGKTVNETKFLEVDDTIRVVLVLDESGSMILDSPNRIERLKVAANDFIALAPSESEVGIVTYATDVTEERVIDSLGSDRSSWNSVIDNMSPDGNTNISAGLLQAKQLISDAGGVTGNTFVVLMTDGLNNEPAPATSANDALEDALSQLQNDGIRVYVTCTGSDFGLQSQCSEIATETGGHYVDSSGSASLPLSFVDIAAFGFGYQKLMQYDSVQSQLLRAQRFEQRDELKQILNRDFSFEKALMSDFLASNPSMSSLLWMKPRTRENEFEFYIEEGASSAMFTIQWAARQGEVKAEVISPSGDVSFLQKMPLGIHTDVDQAESGVWRVRVLGLDNVRLDELAVRGYVRNQGSRVGAGVRSPSVKPGQPIYFYAYPVTNGKAVGRQGSPIQGLLTRPDGESVLVELHDEGRDKFGAGDDVPDDGVFTGVYDDTQLRGAYTLSMFWALNQWDLASDAIGHTHHGKLDIKSPAGYKSPVMIRQTMHTATVVDRERDKEATPEDIFLDKQD